MRPLSAAILVSYLAASGVLLKQSRELIFSEPPVVCVLSDLDKREEVRDTRVAVTS